jgi:ABC-2 type transport system permease protein
MKTLEQLKRSLIITKKDLQVYYGRGPVIVFGLIMPAFLFFSFTLKRGLTFIEVYPGLVGMALFFTVSSIGPIIAPWETRMKTFERLVSTPISLWAIILGDVLASFLFGLLITLVVLLTGVFFLGISFFNPALILGTLFAAFCFSALGTLIGTLPTDNPSNVMMLATLVKFPLIFISGVFVPLQEMGNLKVISFFSPLTYYVDLVKFVFQGNSYFSPTIDLLDN